MSKGFLEDRFFPTSQRFLKGFSIALHAWLDKAGPPKSHFFSWINMFKKRSGFLEGRLFSHNHSFESFVISPDW